MDPRIDSLKRNGRCAIVVAGDFRSSTWINWGRISTYLPNVSENKISTYIINAELYEFFKIRLLLKGVKGIFLDIGVNTIFQMIKSLTKAKNEVVQVNPQMKYCCKM